MILATAFVSAQNPRQALESRSLRDSVANLHDEVIDIWVSFPGEAMKYGQDALSLSTQLKDSFLISKSLRLLSGVFYYQGDLNKSLEYNLKALDIAKAVKDSSLLANSLNNIGLLYYDLGSYTLSYEYLLRALAIKKEIGEDYGVASVYVNIGLIFLRLDLLEEAQENFETAFQLAIDGGSEDDKLYALNNTAYSLLKTGNIKLAVDHFKAGIALGKRIENLNWMAVAQRGAGEAFLSMGKLDSAESYIRESLNTSNSINDRKGAAEALYLQAKLAFTLGKQSEAQALLRQSTFLADKLAIKFQQLQNLKLFSQIYAEASNFQLQAEYLEMYTSKKDSLFDDAIARNLSIVPIKLKEESDRLRLANQEAQLKSKSMANNLYLLAVIVIVPLVVFLIVLLRKNKKKAEELQAYNDDLKKAQNLLITQEKMASLGVLAAGVGHEINNPLNFIKNGVEALSHYIKLEKGDIDPQVESYLRIVDEGVVRATKIVSSLSHFSRAGESKTELCKINEIIENCLLILHNKIRDRIQIVTVFDKGVEMRGNEGRLHQVILNILANAAQAIEDKGTIEIATRKENGSIQIEISDDGSGIPVENLTKIQDPFFTTKPPGEGTGLGLFITSTIIEEHNGKMEVQSQVGVGTRFIITLPTD